MARPSNTLSPQIQWPPSSFSLFFSSTLPPFLPSPSISFLFLLLSFLPRSPSSCAAINHRSSLLNVQLTHLPHSAESLEKNHAAISFRWQHDRFSLHHFRCLALRCRISDRLTSLGEGSVRMCNAILSEGNIHNYSPSSSSYNSLSFAPHSPPHSHFKLFTIQIQIKPFFRSTFACQFSLPLPLSLFLSLFLYCTLPFSFAPVTQSENFNWL